MTGMLKKFLYLLVGVAWVNIAFTQFVMPLSPPLRPWVEAYFLLSFTLLLAVGVPGLVVTLEEKNGQHR